LFCFAAALCFPWQPGQSRGPQVVVAEAAVVRAPRDESEASSFVSPPVIIVCIICLVLTACVTAEVVRRRRRGRMLPPSPPPLQSVPTRRYSDRRRA
jgi:hypothetical protein